MHATIEQVQEYNARRLRDYDRAVDEWTPERGGFPFPGFFTYSTKNGTFRLRGCVVTYNEGRSSHFFSNERKANNFLATI